jgi:hypothetical protein
MQVANVTLHRRVGIPKDTLLRHDVLCSYAVVPGHSWRLGERRDEGHEPTARVFECQQLNTCR